MAKRKLTDRQRRFLFAVGVLRKSKRGEGVVLDRQRQKDFKSSVSAIKNITRSRVKEEGVSFARRERAESIRSSFRNRARLARKRGESQTVAKARERKHQRFLSRELRPILKKG